MQKYGKPVLADQTRDTALGVFGSVGGAEVVKYLTPKYTGPYMRGALKTIGKESGGYLTNTGIFLHSVYDNAEEFKGHPDLMSKAIDYDKEAFYVGEAVAIDEDVVTVTSAGEYALPAKATGAAINFGVSIRVEKKKDELQEEKTGRDCKLIYGDFEY